MTRLIQGGHPTLSSNINSGISKSPSFSAYYGCMTHDLRRGWASVSCLHWSAGCCNCERKHTQAWTTSTRGATGIATPYGEDPTPGGGTDAPLYWGGAGIMMTCGGATAGRGARPYWSC